MSSDDAEPPERDGLQMFGPGRLPEMMGNLGKAMREFQKGLHAQPEVDAPAKPPVDAKRER